MYRQFPVFVGDSKDMGSRACEDAVRGVKSLHLCAGDGKVCFRYDDDLGEFETRLLLNQLLGNEAQATRLSTGWDGDRYAVLGPAADALVWYTAWDDAAAADRFAQGLKTAWAKRRSGGPAGRRSEITRLALGKLPAVRLVDASETWIGWKRLPRVRVASH